ncbi:MAG: hypothetical protein DMG06_16100 [Acidobacteria bacterium]|nr:MAG: hypothetical protein DMG06_16100 [Acidobacteriota bacterium]
MKRVRGLRWWVFSVCCLCGLALTGVSRSWAAMAEEDNKLTTAEEDYAYDAKTPHQRVKAFLRIADAKVESAKRARKRDPSSAISFFLRGYSIALEGAWMGVSWGQAQGTDMTESIRAIEKATRRHSETLRKLEANSSLTERETLSQIQNAAKKSQKSEQNISYTAKK